MARPNILFILVDQMRSTAMGCAGVENVKTPNLDKLAQGGTRFSNAVSNCPSCAPARGSLLTGLHPLAHGVVNNEIQVKLGTGTFAGALRDNGYKCGYIGKWHIDGGYRSAFTPPGERRLGFDDYWAVANCTHDYMDSFYYENDDPEPKWIDGYEPVHQTDLALRYIEKKTGESDPFCLMLSWGTPHDPYQEMPEEDLNEYNSQDIEFMETNSRYVPSEIMEAKQKIVAGYYAHITALDKQLGRLLTLLEEKNSAENTLIIFTSDHGDMLGNKGEYYKSQPWRESVGIPLIMRWPSHIPAGRVTDGPISLTDMMPTVLSMTNSRIPEDTQSDDLSAFVLGNESAAPESVFINFPPNVHVIPSPPFRGVVTRTHTYAETKEGPWLLYDDRADPLQKNNLISWEQRDNPEVVQLQQQLHLKMQAWLEGIGDPFDDGDLVNDKYMPGHVGGVLDCSPDPVFLSKKRKASRL